MAKRNSVTAGINIGEKQLPAASFQLPVNPAAKPEKLTADSKR
jgi:hypothetical protein